MNDSEKRRVEEPVDLNDAESLREYGRQLAMDSLLSELGNEDKVVEVPQAGWNRRTWISASAASLAALAGWSLWKSRGGDNGSGEQLAVLDVRWSLKVSDDVVFQILGPNHIQLSRGELRLTSREPAKLTVDTPDGSAMAKGTDFLIGHYPDAPSNQKEKQMKTKTMTRLLVLAGSVTLTNGQGMETARAREAIVARQDLPPEKILVKANSDFALSLYARLSDENEGENLFLSPFSISNALLMVAEGARGKTAREMGEVLGFPGGLARVGEGSQKIPWEMSVMRAGQMRLNELLNSKENPSPEQLRLRAKEAGLIKKRVELRELAQKAEAGDDSSAKWKARGQLNRVELELNKLRQEIDTLVLRSANAVWADRTMSLLQDWQDTVSGSYGAGAVREANFIEQADAERKEINRWVAGQTEDLIRDLFPENSLTSDTRLVLANAIYFKGNWMTPFVKKWTEEAPFHLSSGEKIQSPMMAKNRDEKARYAAFHPDGSVFDTPKVVPLQGEKPPLYPGAGGWSLLEMPYQGGKASMVVVLPQDPAGLADLEKKLSASNLEKWLGALKNRETNVRLPRFEMATGYDLGPTLAAMGMPSAFSTASADFSGLSESEEVLVSKVVHKAFIQVNEQGTEAAAATGIAMDPTAAPTVVPFTPTFQADRPFLYLIRDTKTGTILFMGRVLNPQD